MAVLKPKPMLPCLLNVNAANMAVNAQALILLQLDLKEALPYMLFRATPKLHGLQRDFPFLILELFTKAIPATQPLQ